MKTKTKFILFYSLGTFFTVFAIALLISALLNIVDTIVPLDELNDISIIIVTLLCIITPVLIGGGLWGIYLAKPILTILSLIRHLSAGQNDLSVYIIKVYNRKGKLKLPYRLYKEVLGDLTQLSEYLSETERKREELEGHKKNWITGVSHDLKTPLSYITGYAELLLSKNYQFEQEERLSFLTNIRNKGVTIGELVEDLSLSFKMDDYNEPLPLSRSQFDFVDFMKRIIADIINDPRAIGYELPLLCDISRIEVNADHRLLQRAIQNIIMNSILHNPQGTSIETSIKVTSSNQVEIDIQDNGCGMEENTLKNLFTRYYRNPIKEDTNLSGGLGLSVAKSILEAHDGKITVTSKPSHGTKFTVVIPL